MKVDRHKFFASVGGTEAVAALSHEDQAEALEHYMTDQLDATASFGRSAAATQAGPDLTSPRGTGNLFTPQPDTSGDFSPLVKMPAVNSLNHCASPFPTEPFRQTS